MKMYTLKVLFRLSALHMGIPYDTMSHGCLDFCLQVTMSAKIFFHATLQQVICLLLMFHYLSCTCLSLTSSKILSPIFAAELQGTGGENGKSDTRQFVKLTD